MLPLICQPSAHRKFENGVNGVEAIADEVVMEHAEARANYQNPARR